MFLCKGRSCKSNSHAINKNVVSSEVQTRNAGLGLSVGTRITVEQVGLLLLRHVSQFHFRVGTVDAAP
jgi:hypothetical protein